MSRQTLVAMRYSQERREDRPSNEVVGPPGPDHGLLDRVLGFEAGAQHPVAVAGELPAVALQRTFEGPHLVAAGGVEFGTYSGTRNHDTRA